MFECVNPLHPDKVADRIAGAIVDLAYSKEANPRIAVEVLLGHGDCNIIIESNVIFTTKEIAKIVTRITKDKTLELNLNMVQQDPILANNQKFSPKCGDNGIFRGMPISYEETKLFEIAHEIYNKFKSDGKYIFDANTSKLIICQSNATTEQLAKMYPDAIINPLGDWTGGLNVDSGATNRKLGSDMGEAVTGGGLHGKDLSKADVSVNIYAHILAQQLKQPVEAFCAIGDEVIEFRFDHKILMVTYPDVMTEASKYIQNIGGFEKFAEWGFTK